MLWKHMLMLLSILYVGWSVHGLLAVPSYTKHCHLVSHPPCCRPLSAAKDNSQEEGAGWRPGKFVSNWFQGDEEEKLKKKKKKKAAKEAKKKQQDRGMLRISKRIWGDKDKDTDVNKDAKKGKKKVDLSDSSLFVGPKLPFTENLEDKVSELRKAVGTFRGTETPQEAKQRLAEEKKQIEKLRKEQEERRKQQQKEKEQRKREEKAEAQAKEDAARRAAEQVRREAEARREEARRQKERQARQKRVQQAAAGEQEPERKPGLEGLLSSISPLKQEEAPKETPEKRSSGNPLSVVQKLAKNVWEKKEQWIVVMPKTKIAPGGIVPVVAGGLDLLLIASRDGERLHCVANSCSHLGTPLETGLLFERPVPSTSSEKPGLMTTKSSGAAPPGAKKCEDCIVCPLHRTTFALDSGEVRGEWCPYPPVIGKVMGAVKEETPLVVFDVRTKGKNIEVRINSSLDVDDKGNKAADKKKKI